MGVKFGNKVIDKIYIGDREIDKVFLGDKEVYSAISFEGPSFFIDTSGSPGSPIPIEDLDGNLMFDEAKGIAYYGTVSHTDLYTSDELASEVGVTQGNSLFNQEVWHKYYWNGGIHFFRKQIRNNISWNSIAAEGAVYGTGTTTSRKGHSGTTVNQNAEVTKNGVTYAVRLMEGANVDPGNLTGSNFHNSEFSLILMNLHAATNSGEYSNSPTDGVTYNNWLEPQFYTNNDFVGWKTNFGDSDFGVGQTGQAKWQQEAIGGNRLSRTFNRMDAILENNGSLVASDRCWSPVLTVKHSSFTYE